MLTYSLENRGKMPLYEALYRAIRADIEAGRLQPGEKLPSKRALARHLGISTITVEGAYGQLMAEGYCTSQPKRGVYVTAGFRPQASSKEAFPSLQAFETMQAVSGEAPRAPLHDEVYPAEQEAWPPVEIDFAEGGGNAENFPFALWTRLLRRVVSEEADELLERSPWQGVLPLRAAIADHLRQFRGLAVAPSQIIIGAGTEYLYGLLVQFFGRERRFCMENPGYGRIWHTYEAFGATCLFAGLDAQGVRLTDLAHQRAEILHISPSHHYPTGLITPISRRYELLGWAAGGEDRFIIEDDYDSEFRLTGRPIPTLMIIDATGCVLYMNTFSKTLTPTIRISYLVLPERLVEPFRAKLGFYSCTVSNFEQYTLARFIAEGHFERHIHRMRTLYRKRRAAILTLLKRASFADRLNLMEQGSGLHFLVRFRQAGTDEEIARKLRAAGIRMRPLADCYVPAEKAGMTEKNTSCLPEDLQGVFVLDYSSVSEVQMEEAIRRIGEALYGITQVPSSSGNAR